MPHRRHHRGGFRGGRRFGGPRTVVYEEAVILNRPDDLDVLFVPPTDDPEPKIPQAGMTFFEHDEDDDFLSMGAPYRPASPDAKGPDENITRAAEIDRAISALMRDMSQNMRGDQDFLNLGQDVLRLQADWAAWRTDHMSFFQMVGTENDLNRFSDAYNVLRSRFVQIVGKQPSAPGLSNPTPSNPLGLPSVGDTTKLVAAVGVVAALFFFGKPLARLIS